MNAWARAAITLAIAVALAYLLLSLARDEDVQGEAPTKCISTTPEEDAQLKRMMGRAFDRAFENQIASLFKVYTTNAPSVAQQQQYTKVGMENAIAAWRVAMTAVDNWEGCK